MAAFDLVLAKMKSVGAAPLPAKVSPKAKTRKRKQPEPDASTLPSPLPLTCKQPVAETQPDKLRNRKKKQSQKAKAADAPGLAHQSEPQTASQTAAAPQLVVQAGTEQTAASPKVHFCICKSTAPLSPT